MGENIIILRNIKRAPMSAQMAEAVCVLGEGKYVNNKFVKTA